MREGCGMDLRRWLEEMQAAGQVQEMLGADWNLELGTISEINVKRPQHRALLFDEIVGYPKGYRVLTCTTGTPKRLASILRLPVEEGSHKALVAALRGKPGEWEARAKDYPPVQRKDAPAFERVMEADAVDVLAFPAPRWHERDGGRYIGTGCAVVTRDYDSDWVNVGTYRVMVHDRNHVGLDMVAGKHGHIQYRKYMEAQKPFPVAIVVGRIPCST